MECLNVDLEIRFNFEFGNTQRTLVMVECKSCLPHLSQETTFKIQYCNSKELSENEKKCTNDLNMKV